MLILLHCACAFGTPSVSRTVPISWPCLQLYRVLKVDGLHRDKHVASNPQYPMGRCVILADERLMKLAMMGRYFLK